MKITSIVCAALIASTSGIAVLTVRAQGVSPSKSRFNVLPLLGKNINQVNKVLGKPKYIGEEGDHYYKLNGFVRVVVVALPKENMMSITFQFPKGQVKSWKSAFSSVGIDSSGAQQVPTKRPNSVSLSQIKGAPKGREASWNTPGDSDNDELILFSPDSP